ncbi:MAG: helix-turn-helix transcriptional regulator [Nanoarchaeota archaeon]
MKRQPVVGIKPSIFRWARISAGLSIDTVAEKLKQHPDKIKAWEAGKTTPTYLQLEKLAYKIYKQPLAIFFFPSPPRKKRSSNYE